MPACLLINFSMITNEQVRRHAVGSRGMVSSERNRNPRKISIDASTTTLGLIITIALHLDDVAPPSSSGASISRYRRCRIPSGVFLSPFRYGCLVRDMTFEWVAAR